LGDKNSRTNLAEREVNQRVARRTSTARGFSRSQNVPIDVAKEHGRRFWKNSQMAHFFLGSSAVDVSIVYFVVIDENHRKSVKMTSIDIMQVENQLCALDDLRAEDKEPSTLQTTSEASRQNTC